MQAVSSDVSDGFALANRLYREPQRTVKNQQHQRHLQNRHWVLSSVVLAKISASQSAGACSGRVSPPMISIRERISRPFS